MKPTRSQAIGAYTPFRAKKRRWLSETSQGRKTIHRKMRKSKCLTNKCLLGQAETMGHREDC